MLLFHKYWDFFLTDQHISNVGLNECENASFVQSETRTIVPRNVNLCRYEIIFFLAVSIAPVYYVLFRLEQIFQIFNS